MASEPTQFLLLKSPLGDDTQPFQQSTLHATDVVLQDCLSQPFAASLTVVSTHRALQPGELLGQRVTLTMRRKPQADRLLNGVVRRMEAIGFPQRGRWRYRLDVAPTLWFLSQNRDCRIFQQQSMTDILRCVFEEHGVQPVTFRLYDPQVVRPYTTQYNETDLDFVHRLLQESGCFYFFEHTADQHRLVVTDRNHAFQPMPNPVHWVVHEGDNIDILDEWRVGAHTDSSLVTMQDYDPAHPAAPIIGKQKATGPTAIGAERTAFEWPAATKDKTVASDRARFQIEASEAQAASISAHGYDPCFCPGLRFQLGRDPFTGAEQVEYAIRAITLRASDHSWTGGGNAAQVETDIIVIPQETPWRDRLTLPRPAMPGVFSATVLGESGEEIHADEMGRIKVRLRFDHREDTSAAMAIWARVLQPWSGQGWGWQHLPRVGTEVGVSFMNGDPDEPVVVGCFYHQQMRPPFPIPAEQTKSGFRSRSTRHGGVADYSELSFDDRKGQEEVLLHAQRDLRTEVERNQSLEVGEDRDVRIDGNETITIRGTHRLATERGSISITAETGAVDITATQSLTLRVMDNMIRISPAGVQIIGNLIGLDAAGVLNANAGQMNLIGVSAVGIVAPIVFSTPIPIPNPAVEEQVEEAEAVTQILAEA